MGNEYLTTPLWDGRLSEDERLDYLLRHLTLEEKFRCLTNGCPEIPRLGVPAFGLGGEGAHGVQARHDQSYDKGERCYTTVFPNPIGMSATWDRELIKEAGKVVGREARGLFHAGKHKCLSLWAPTVDMIRDPRWGRVEEGYGEDPFQVGEMAGAYVSGIQGEDAYFLQAGATLKHFYANNVEEGRTYISSTIDLRNKHEYYLVPFRHIVKNYHAEGIMTAYNEVNGIPAMLLEDEIKMAKEWGVGHIVCDGADVNQTVNFHKYFSRHSETIAAGLEAGIDGFTDEEALITDAAREAFDYRMMTEEQMDRALKNHFRVMMRLGLFEKEGRNPYSRIGLEEVDSQKNHQLARTMTSESVVLLKNDGILPLCKEDYVHKNALAVIGPLSDVWNKDWYGGMPSYVVTPLQGIENVTDCVAESGRSRGKIRLHPETKHRERQTSSAEVKYLGILEDGRTIGAVDETQAEVFEFEEWGDGKVTLRAMSNKKLLTMEDDVEKGQEGIVTATSEEAFGWFVKEMFFMPCSNGADEDVEYEPGNATERSKMLSWDGKRLELDKECRLVKSGLCKESDEQEWEEKTRFTTAVEWTKDGIGEAVKIARDAKTVIMFVGAHPMITCKEEIDRAHIQLPKYQQQLMKAVREANPKTVLVLISSVPYDMTWAKEWMPAVLMEAGGSMELGNGIADILFGKESPAGRTNMTWYGTNKQFPEMEEYDIIQKNRTYQYDEDGICYPFGYGLSYTTFAYRNMSVTCRDFTHINISVDVENTGAVVSDEVAQIYYRKENSEVKRPYKTLVAFERVKNIMPGEVRHLDFVVSQEQLKYFDVICEGMLLESGEYCFMAGSSSQDIMTQKSIVLQGEKRPNRDGFSRNQAQNYDRSEGIVLDCGQKVRYGKLYRTVVCTKNGVEDVCLSYDKMYLENEAKQLVLDFWQEYLCDIEILAGDKSIGTFRIGKPEEEKKEYQVGEANGEGAFQCHENWLTKRREIGFREIAIPLSEVPIKKEFTLTIRWNGKGKLSTYQFA